MTDSRERALRRKAARKGIVAIKARNGTWRLAKFTTDSGSLQIMEQIVEGLNPVDKP